MEIVAPRDNVVLKKHVLNRTPEEYVLTFEVVGRCDDCSDDERVDLYVRPRTAAPNYEGRAVKEVVDDRWAADVFVGDNRGNRIVEGDRLDIEAVVLHQYDLVIWEGRAPKPPPRIRGRATATVVVRGVP
jgi:hypothetical protein